MADYIREHGNDIKEIADDLLKRKGQLLIPDYLDFIQQPGHQGDEIVVYLLAQMGNRAICIVAKKGYWSTLRGGLGRQTLYKSILDDQFFMTQYQILIRKAVKCMNRNESIK